MCGLWKEWRTTKLSGSWPFVILKLYVFNSDVVSCVVVPTTRSKRIMQMPESSCHFKGLNNNSKHNITITMMVGINANNNLLYPSVIHFALFVTAVIVIAVTTGVCHFTHGLLFSTKIKFTAGS